MGGGLRFWNALVTSFSVLFSNKSATVLYRVEWASHESRARQTTVYASLVYCPLVVKCWDVLLCVIIIYICAMWKCLVVDVAAHRAEDQQVVNWPNFQRCTGTITFSIYIYMTVALCVAFGLWIACFSRWSFCSCYVCVCLQFLVAPENPGGHVCRSLDEAQCITNFRLIIKWLHFEM